MGRALRVERLLPYGWTSQAPQSALLLLDRVSEVKGGRLGWWFLERSREDERDWEGVPGGGSVEVAARKRPDCASQAISHFKEGGMPEGGLTQVEFSGRSHGPKWESSSIPPFPAGLASAILGTVARRPRLPALPLSTLCPSFRKLT